MEFVKVAVSDIEVIEPVPPVLINFVVVLPRGADVGVYEVAVPPVIVQVAAARLLLASVISET